ncbi:MULTISPECIES: S9 family peptidase [unclassified Gemella]|uniref:S9 family peptidase n=1 Tax=unclassified Gemella TaxID=2624949 RepID=UPI001C04AB5E|nr:MULTISPECIES: S9 family peptidase [unclassified Gemella]MBU0278036.1 S9 family peptidase [Gemella sp. zg-1178]QWQ38434.1 S9 family peptidase [Gemella sp. zg-570]
MNFIKNESLFDLNNVGNPVLLDKYIFYTQTTTKEATNTYETKLFRIDINTKAITEWGNGGSVYTNLELSPNKDKILFLSNNTKDKKNQLFSMSLSGGMAKQLTFEKEGISNYIFKEDKVYYHTSSKQEEKENKSEDKNNFPKENVIDKVMYKADGVGLLASNLKYQFKKLELGKSEDEVLIEKNENFTINYISKCDTFALMSMSKNIFDEWQYGNLILKYDFNTKKESKLFDTEDNFYFVNTNPKENKILFILNDFSYKFVTQNNLVVYDLETKKLTNITEKLDIEIGDLIVADFQQSISGVNFEWLNDDEFIFSSTEKGKILLYTANVNGQIKNILNKEIHITGSSFCDNKIAITYSTLNYPSGLALFDIAREEFTDIYNPNEKFLKGTKLAKIDRFWFKAHDDLYIQGWYVNPLAVKENNPAILYVHGGPQVCYGESFFHEMQVLASKGYGVIMLNPRGGGSYGQKFVSAILGDYGNNDFKDLMTGLEYVLEKYSSIDRSRVYLAGGSYGGFMTNWIVGHSNIFKAAVAQRSISNWISFYGTSDIGAFFVEYQLERNLNNMEKLWAMSPLAYAKNVKTPLLLLHGDDDLRCPKEQAEQMYIALKRNNIKTKLIIFPQSSHGLSREGLPNLRIARLKAIQDWFEEN